VGDFRVDVDRMRDTLRKLDECDDRMRDASRRLNKVGPNGLGTEGLDKACDEFQSEWKDGITRIADTAKKVHENLSRTLEAYTTTDQQTAEALSK